MSLSYKKLWKQLIDRDMTLTELVGEMMEVVLDDKSHGTEMSDKRRRRKVK